MGIHRILYKKRLGRNPQKGKASAFMNGIITLSNSINEMLENKEVTPTELNLLFKEALDNQLDKIEDITGTRPKLIEYSIHYDEKTPHLHYLTTNYDEKGRSLHHKLKTSKRLSELQDQAGEDFMPIGFERGQKKGFVKPLSIAEMHQIEIKNQKEELKALKYEFRDIIKEIKEHKKELKSTISDKEELKEELKYLDKQLKFARETIKSENMSIDTLKQEKSRLRQDMSFLEEKIDTLEKTQNILVEENELLTNANASETPLDRLQEDIKKINSIYSKVQNNDYKLNEVPELTPKPRKHK